MTTLFEVLRQQSLDTCNNHDFSQYKLKPKKERASIHTIQEKIVLSSEHKRIYDTSSSDDLKYGKSTNSCTISEPTSGTNIPKPQKRISRGERLRRKQEQEQEPTVTADATEEVQAESDIINSIIGSTVSDTSSSGGPPITRTFSNNVEFLQELAKEAAPPVRRRFSDNVLFLQELAKDVAADAPPVRQTFSNNIEFLQDLAEEVHGLAKEAAADHMDGNSSSTTQNLTRRLSNSMGYLQGLAQEASNNLLDTVTYLREEEAIHNPDVLKSVVQEKMECLGKNVGTLTKSAFGSGSSSSSSSSCSDSPTVPSSPLTATCQKRRGSRRQSLRSIDLSKLMETTPLETAEGLGDSSHHHMMEVTARRRTSSSNRGDELAQIGLIL